MKYQFIAQHRQEYPISTLCRVLEVASSGYYAWLKRAPSRRSQENTRLGERIRRIYHANRQVYGSPRIHAVLRAEGHPCGKKRVARLMREQGLSAKARKHRTQPSQPPRRPIRNGWPTSPRSGRWRAGSIWPLCSTFSRGWSSAGRWMPIAMKCWLSKLLAWPSCDGSRGQA